MQKLRARKEVCCEHYGECKLDRDNRKHGWSCDYFSTKGGEAIRHEVSQWTPAKSIGFFEEASYRSGVCHCTEENNRSVEEALRNPAFTNAPSGCDTEQALEYFRIMLARALQDIRLEKLAARASSDLVEGTHTVPTMSRNEIVEGTDHSIE